MHDKMAISAYIFERVEKTHAGDNPLYCSSDWKKFKKYVRKSFVSWRLRGSLSNIFKSVFLFNVIYVKILLSC